MDKKEIIQRSQVFVVGEFAEIISPLNKNYNKFGMVTFISLEKDEVKLEGRWWDTKTSSLYYSKENYKLEELKTNEITKNFKKRERPALK